MEELRNEQNPKRLIIICDCGSQDTSLAHVNACPRWQARLRKNWQEPKVLDRGERLLVNELNRPYYMNQVRQDSYYGMERN